MSRDREKKKKKKTDSRRVQKLEIAFHHVRPSSTARGWICSPLGRSIFHPVRIMPPLPSLPSPPLSQVRTLVYPTSQCSLLSSRQQGCQIYHRSFV